MNIRQAIQSGLLFGLFMGLVFVLPFGIAKGMSTGLLGGLFFGLLIYLFANSRIVTSQTAVSNEFLLPGERFILTEGANFVVKPKDFGLKKLAFDDLLWTVGMKNKEALGGKIHLTNYRLIFKSHNFNRLRGMTSIFLPTVMEAKNTSFFITRKMTIQTFTSKVDFVLYDVDMFIRKVNEQKKMLTQSTIADIKEYVAQEPYKCSDSLKLWNSLNVVNNLIAIGRKVGDGLDFVKEPLEALSAIFVKELFDETIGDSWQEKFEIQNNPQVKNRSIAIFSGLGYGFIGAFIGLMFGFFSGCGGCFENTIQRNLSPIKNNMYTHELWKGMQSSAIKGYIIFFLITTLIIFIKNGNKNK